MNLTPEQTRELHKEIQDVCPIVGVSPSKDRIDFHESATEEQRIAAHEVMRNFYRRCEEDK